MILKDFSGDLEEAGYQLVRTEYHNDKLVLVFSRPGKPDMKDKKQTNIFNPIILKF